jgi:F-type H+-transporting ATPase subunit gamma
MDTLENLKRKIGSAGELKSVVKTMKAMAASNIVQFEMAATALNDYYNTVSLGMIAYFSQEKNYSITQPQKNDKGKSICALVFGSDQGLVGQFNEELSDFTTKSLNEFSEKKVVWAVGKRMQDRLADSDFIKTKLFPVRAITVLVGNILIDIETARENGEINEFYIFNNRLKIGTGYEPVSLRLLPLDYKWERDLKNKKWPTNKLPQIVGGIKPTLFALIKEYLFVSIYKACAESLASENESRLEAMQRAEKNIDEIENELNNKYHQLRQSSIDEELFDVVSGFEALKKNKNLPLK